MHLTLRRAMRALVRATRALARAKRAPVRRDRAVFVGAAVLVAVLAACDDPFRPRATTEVRTDTFTVFAMNGTPVNVPSAFNLVFFVPVRIDPSYSFDLAFDIDANGSAVVYPVRLIGGAVTATRQVGLQKATVPYDQVTRAPSGGFRYDSTLTVDAGETVIIELAAEQCAFASVSQLVVAKLEMLDIDASRRLMAFRITYDPNCGFRSLLPGLPKD